MSATAWIARIGHWVYDDHVEMPVEIVALTYDWWHALSAADGQLEAGEEPMPVGTDGCLYYVRFRNTGSPLDSFWPDSPPFSSLQEAMRHAELKTPRGVGWEPSSVIELELWLPPGRAEAPMDGKLLSERCRRETGLPPEFVLGLNFVPDESDIRRLEQGIESGCFSHESFVVFCENRSLPIHPISARAASEFLAFEEGQPLAWLHLPTESHGLAIAQALLCWSDSNRLQIRDGAISDRALSKEQILGSWSLKSHRP